MKNYIDEIYKEEDIVKTTHVYSETPHFECDVYMPPRDTDEKLPVVIWLPGGGGTKEGGVGWALGTWAVRGYVGITAKFKDDVGDFGHKDQMMAVSNAYALIRWIRSNVEKLGFDRKRIFITGVSAGGLVALSANIASNNAQNDYDVFFTGIEYNRSNPDKKIKVLASATFPGAATDFFYDLIGEKDKPNYAYHGTEDPLLNYNQIVKVTNKMIEKGVPSTLMSFEGDDHTIGSHTKEIKDDLIPKFATLTTQVFEDEK